MLDLLSLGKCKTYIELMNTLTDLNFYNPDGEIQKPEENQS